VSTQEFAFAPKATAQSPGLPLRVPWEKMQFLTYYRNAVVTARSVGRNRLAVENSFASPPRVAEAATLGFEP
jgi:hypothetical protein